MSEHQGLSATKVVSSMVWSSADRFGSMGLQFIINLVLARLLVPEDFGIIGVLWIFIAISETFIDGGFASALIQKKNPTQTDFSTVFFWGLTISVGMYVLLFILAPFIEIFFKIATLADILRVIGLLLVFHSVTSVQIARLRKQLSFKILAIVDIIAYFTSGTVGILFAFHGFGAWSLVAQQLTQAIVIALALFVVTKWYPTLTFSVESLKTLFSFGGYILATNVLQEICRNFQGILIGRKFSAKQMGLYAQANKLDVVVSWAIPQSLVMVLYPAYSSLQDDKAKLISTIAMNIRVIAYAIYPILGLLIMFAKPVIISLYGMKWVDAIPYYQILCVGGFFVCLQNINFYAVAAYGNSRALFKWSFYRWGFLLCALIIGSNFGMRGILYGIVISNLNIYIVNAYLVQKFIGLKIWWQVKSILPTIVSVLVCGFCTLWAYNYLNIHFLMCAVIFVFLYIVCTYRQKSASELKNLIEALIAKKCKRI